MSAVSFTVVPRSEPTFQEAKDVRKILRDNLPILRQAMIYLEVKPLHSLIAVALENFVSNREQGVCGSLFARCNYIETGLISSVCLVYNFVMALLLTPLAIASCGRKEMINNAFSKHWLHSAIAACGIGISVLGFVSPLFGAVVTGGILSVIISRVRNAWNDLKLPSKKERVKIAAALYMQHRDDLAEGLKELATNKDQVKKMIKKIDRAMSEARSLEELLTKCLQGVVHRPQAQN